MKCFKVHAFGLAVAFAFLAAGASYAPDAFAAQATVDGQALYSSSCAGCHGDFAAPAVPVSAGGPGRKVLGAGVCVIRASINGTSVFPGGVPAMQFLKGTLSDAQTAAIADYLNSEPVSGQKRYEANCAGCHGMDARGGRTGTGVRGSDAGEISEVISEENAMRFLSCLSQTSLNAIGGYLQHDVFLPTTTTTMVPVTTTLGSSTTTTTIGGVTTTTLATDHCGAPQSHGSRPIASDCFVILKAAVGAGACAQECLCAPKGTLPITATDALVCLKSAVGQNVTLDCPCGTVTTTLGATTTTSIGTATTTTVVAPTTTTTLAGGSSAGQQIYDARCASCHSAGAYDPAGFAPDLAGRGSALVTDLSTISPVMAGMHLTAQEMLDLATFLNSL